MSPLTKRFLCQGRFCAQATSQAKMLASSFGDCPRVLRRREAAYQDVGVKHPRKNICVSNEPSEDACIFIWRLPASLEKAQSGLSRRGCEISAQKYMCEQHPRKSPSFKHKFPVTSH